MTPAQAKPHVTDCFRSTLYGSNEWFDNLPAEHSMAVVVSHRAHFWQILQIKSFRLDLGSLSSTCTGVVGYNDNAAEEDDKRCGAKILWGLNLPSLNPNPVKIINNFHL